jgi:nucleoid-associated protein YgaU
VLDLGSGLFVLATLGLVIMLGLAATAALTADRAPVLAARCRRMTPAGCRRVVAVVLGFGMVAAVPIGGAATADAQPTQCRVRCPFDLPSLAGLRLPDLPLSPPHRHDPRGVPQTGTVTGTAQIEVRPGDSLWRIAEHRCGPGASTAQIAELTNRLYILNRTTIGSDPDLIFPGMTLDVPEGKP